MSDIINNFINSINIEEEIKKNQLKNSTIQGTNQTTQAVENQELGGVDTAIDVAASGATGAAHGITYVIDLPFYLVQGFESGSEYVLEKAASALGFNLDEYNDIKSDFQIASENKKPFRPGEWLRDNVFTYEPKSKLGEYTGTAAEWAAPGGVLGKTQKARNLFMATGAASGATKQGITNVTDGNELAGTGVGIGLNLGLDLLALKKGNLAILSKEFLPSNTVIEKAKKIQKEAKKNNLNLTVGETTGSSQIQKLEGSVTASIAGNKVMDKFWSERPDKLKVFIEKWAKENGVIIQNRRFISDKDYYTKLKKAAVELSTQRSLAWQRAGGDKLQKFYYPSQEVDNLVIQWKNLTKNMDVGDAKSILQFAKNLNKTKGNGQAMHELYRQVSFTFRELTKNPSKNARNLSEIKKYKEMYTSLNTLMSKNKDYVKAQKSWVKFDEEYAKPLTKGSITQLFKSLSDGKSAEDVGTIAKMWKFLDTKAAPKDIALMAKSINKSGVNNLWSDVVSGYFNQAFLKSQSKHIDNGLSGGVILHDALMKNPKQKANFVEMLYQLSLTKNKSIKKIDVEKAVNSFANILKATGQSGKQGSTTAANLLFKEQAGKSNVEFVAGGFPIKSGIVNWWKDRTFSKNSEIIAKALTSDKGIQAFIDLTQDWKDYNKAFSLLRAVTVGAGELN